MYVHRRGPTRRGPMSPPAPCSTYPTAPEPRPERGLLGSAGPSCPPRASSLPGGHGGKGLSAQSSRAVEAVAAAGRPVRPARGLPLGPSPEAEGQRARDRATPRSPPAAAAAASAWPGGSSLSRQPPLDGTGATPGAAAKLPTSEGAVVAAAAVARRPPSRIKLTGRLSHAEPRGAPRSRAGGARLRRDDRGAAGGDLRRSLQRRLGRSCRRRRWATAPPGPHARLRH
ncbi:spidroin-2 [Pteropus medius]|uniref:spidroin-2-like n=1 Tax=Pteropus vampyrus TaxID=132908 RepID=UPI00196A523F|nr:spidroin-2-like [Pteropus giganteus]XP_039742136.1 spidroin-2-like [Pteropus giganteus]